MIVVVLVPLITPNASAMCAGPLEWWEPCNDTGPYSEGIYEKYTILIPALTGILLVSGIVLLIYRKKENEKQY